MRNYTLIAILFFGKFAFSQLEEGYIQYNIDVKANDTTLSVRQGVAMLRDSKMEIYFAEGRNRIDFKMGELYTTSILINKSTNAAITLISSMMGKYATLNYADELKYNSTGTNINQY